MGWAAGPLGFYGLGGWTSNGRAAGFEGLGGRELAAPGGLAYTGLAYTGWADGL